MKKRLSGTIMLTSLAATLLFLALFSGCKGPQSQSCGINTRAASPAGVKAEDYEGSKGTEGGTCGEGCPHAGKGAGGCRCGEGGGSGCPGRCAERCTCGEKCPHAGKGAGEGGGEKCPCAGQGIAGHCKHH